MQSSGFGCVAHQRTCSAGEDRIEKGLDHMIWNSIDKKSFIVVFPCAGFQSVHLICRGDHSESSDAGGSEELCCRTSFALRTQVSTAS